jgi:hypothetical protein
MRNNGSKRGIRAGAAAVVLAAGVAIGAESGPADASVTAGEMALPANRWTKIADLPADPLGRELEPGRGAYFCYEPVRGQFLRYGGYTPTEGNDLWRFDLPARRWTNEVAVSYAWPPPSDRPGAGAFWDMAFDAKRSCVWFCNGMGVASRKVPELFNDIWRYDPASGKFAAMKSQGLPAFSAICRVVYDSRNDLVVRAPGYSGEWNALCNRNRTWVYDPVRNAWDARVTTNAPEFNTKGVAFVYAADIGKCVYLDIGKDNRIDTWTYDAASNLWARLPTATRPPARVFAGAAYDPDNRAVVICGGVGSPGSGYAYLFRGGGLQLADTWALDVAKGEWKKLDVGVPLVPKLPNENPSRFELMCGMGYDTRSRTLVLAAPTVGVWALRYRPEGSADTAPLKLAPLPPASPATPPATPVYTQAPPNPRLLGLATNVWTKLEGGTAIGGGEVPWIYDEATGFCLKYGGCNNGGAGAFASGYGNDLSAYDPATERWLALRWVDPCGPPRPPNGCTRGYACDPVRKVIWFAGGTAGNILSSSTAPGLTSANSTWSYNSLADRFEQVPVAKGASLAGGDRVVCCFDRERDLFIFNAKLYAPAAREWTQGGTGLPVMHYTYACYAASLHGMFVVSPRSNACHTLVYDADLKGWRELQPGGDTLPYAAAAEGAGPFTAYAPENDVVLCVLAKKTFAYRVKSNAWQCLDVKTPDVAEAMVYDTRHKVFLATGAMGRNVWAFRCP